MDISEIIQKPVVYCLASMERAQVRPNIAYTSVQGDNLCLDVYYPAAFTFDTILPAVIFIHGDGPVEMIHDVKDWGQYVSWGQLAAASGLIGISFNHRGSGGDADGKKNVAEDIRELIAYVRGHAVELNLNAEKLCIWAGSAGVPYLQEFLVLPPAFIRCLVTYYGWMDFELKSWDIPPLFIAQAGLDDPAIISSIERFYAAAISFGAKVTLVHHPIGHHAFDILDDNEISKSIIAQTLSFMRKNLLD